MQCKKCGNELNDKDVFCRNCGAKAELNTQEATPENEVQQKKEITISEDNKKDPLQDHDSKLIVKRKKINKKWIYVFLGLMILGGISNLFESEEKNSDDSDLGFINLEDIISKDTDNKNVDTSNKTTDTEKREIKIQDIFYGEWLNDDMTSHNTALDGIDKTPFKILSAEKNDPKYKEIFGEGYYMEVELQMNNSVMRELYYAENETPSYIKIRTDYCLNGCTSQYTSTESTYHRPKDYPESNRQLIDETGTEIDNPTSREKISKAFIGEWHAEYSDLNKGKDVPNILIGKDGKIYHFNGAYEYIYDDRNETKYPFEFISAKKNDPDYTNLYGDGYYYEIAFDVSEYGATTESYVGMLMYIPSLNSDCIIVMIDNNYDKNKPNFSDPHDYYRYR